MSNSKQYQVRKSQANQKWLCPRRKLIYQPYYQDINCRIPLTLMSLVFSLKHYQTKLWNWKIKNAVVVNTVKSDSPGYAQPVLQVKNYRYRFAWIWGHRSHFFTTKYNISNTTDGSRCFIGSLKVSVGETKKSSASTSSYSYTSVSLLALLWVYLPSLFTFCISESKLASFLQSWCSNHLVCLALSIHSHRLLFQQFWCFVNVSLAYSLVQSTGVLV